MIAFLVIACFITSMIVIAKYSEIEAYKTETAGKPVIKFDTFLKFYSINPDRWKLKWGCVECTLPTEGSGMIIKPRTESFYFSYKDFKKYQKWRLRQDEYLQSLQNDKVIAEMLSAVREDIQSAESQISRNIKTAEDILQTIHKNPAANNKGEHHVQNHS